MEVRNPIDELLDGNGKDGKGRVQSDAMIRLQQQSPGSIKYIIESSTRDQIADLMMRTIFDSREELILFLSWVRYVRKFHLKEDNLILYLQGKPSVGGRSREEAIEISNTFKWIESQRRDKSKDYSKPRRLPFG